MSYNGIVEDLDQGCHLIFTQQILKESLEVIESGINQNKGKNMFKKSNSKSQINYC
jgi:hypothetical protein